MRSAALPRYPLPQPSIAGNPSQSSRLPDAPTNPYPPPAAVAVQASSERGGHEPPAGDGATRRPKADSKSEIRNLDSGCAMTDDQSRVPYQMTSPRGPAQPTPMNPYGSAWAEDSEPEIDVMEYVRLMWAKKWLALGVMLSIVVSLPRGR